MAKHGPSVTLLKNRHSPVQCCCTSTNILNSDKYFYLVALTRVRNEHGHSDEKMEKHIMFVKIVPLITLKSISHFKSSK